MRKPGAAMCSGRPNFTVGGGNSGSLAWGGIAGIDYFWTPQITTFVEYNYLEYVALDLGQGNRRFGQQLMAVASGGTSALRCGDHL